MSQKFAIDPREFFQEIDARLFARSVWRVRWRILQLTVLSSVFAALVMFTIPWSQSITATLRIEPELSTAGEKSHIDTETAVVVSWPIVSKAVDLTGAYAVVDYRDGFWLRFSRFLASGLGGGGKKFLRTLELKRFEVPDAYLEKKFILRAQEAGKYILFAPDGERLLEGGVGKIAQTRDAKSPILVLVGGIAAKEGDEFHIIPKSQLDYVQWIQDHLNATRIGIRNSNGVIDVTFRTQDTIFGRRFLDTLLDVYCNDALQRSIQGKMGMLDKIHASNQVVEERLRQSRIALEKFQEQERTVDLSKESSERIRLLAEIKGKMVGLESEKADLLSTRTDSHPSVKAVNDQIASYERQMEEIEAALSSTPALERELFNLTRQVESLKQIYLSNAVEINRLTNEVSGITGYAQIMNRAIVQKKSVLPKAIIAAIFVGMLAIFCSLSAILIRNIIFLAFIRNPDMLRIGAKMPVIASIPRSTTVGKGSKNGYAKYMMLPNDKAAGAIRDVESKIKFITHSADNNVVLFTSDVEHQGKSFLASNFALFSSENRRTLLIDADVVNGDLHSNLGVGRAPGFSDLIVGAATLDEVLLTPMESQLSFIPAGTVVPSHSLLHDSEKLNALMQTLSEKFDLIIVDYPAVISQIEDPQMLSFAGTAFLVVRHGEMASRVKRFLAQHPQGLAKVSAILLNDVT